MADAVSSSSAEVEGFIAPPGSVQPQFDPALLPEPPQQQHGALNEKSSRWSPRDDVQLCDALIAQRGLGRNRDAAVFSMDAWEAVAEQMKGSEILSGGAKKTVVQCKARWQRLKIEYRIVKHLRQQPGFEWDENTQMVKAVAATWDAYVGEHRDAQPWRKKAFPCYSRVAFLIEGESGRDAGEEKFKRRWESYAQSTQRKEGEEPSASTNDGAASTTSVFSVSAPLQPIAPNMPFAAQVVPGVAMTLPLNGGQSGMHQYRFATQQVNGKRVEAPGGDQQASKRPKSAASNAVTTTSPQISQPEGYANTYSAQPPQPYPPGPPVFYTAPPAPVVTAPPVTSASQLALAIQSVEDSEGLSEADFVKAVQLFQRRMEAADAYLAIQSKRARSLYLKAELDEFARS